MSNARGQGEQVGYEGVANGLEALPERMVGELKALGAIACGQDALLAGGQTAIHLNTFGAVIHSSRVQSQVDDVCARPADIESASPTTSMPARVQINAAVVLPSALYR